MFKKSIVAMACLGAFAYSAQAADVNMYGTIDLGFAYTNQEFDAERVNPDKAVHSDSDEFRMDSGNHSASRFGIKGTEDLGNGMIVGFKLENGFDADTGSLTTDDTLFDREATLSLSTQYGTLYMGRMGTLISDTGSVGFFGAMASAFGSGWSDNISGHTKVFANYTTRMDNALAYVSPTMNGLTIYAQYAMGENGVENKSAANRYAALGAEYKAGVVDMGVILDWMNKSTKNSNLLNGTVDDAWTMSWAASVDLGYVKPYVAIQYYQDASDVAGMIKRSIEETANFKNNADSVTRALNVTAMDGYGIHLGASAPVFGGDMLFGVGYSDGDGHNWVGQGTDVKAYTASVGFEYPLSKRTKLYTGAGYVKTELDMHTDRGTLSDDYDAYDFVMGMVHTF